MMAAQMTDFKVISLNVAMSLLSISDVLNNDNPDLLFLQEVSNSTQTLCDKVDSLGYWGECNVDPLHPSLPGTAVVWRKTLNISEVNQLIERRAQSVKCAGETFINVYAPSGSSNRRERWEFFNELFTHIVQTGGVKLPVMAGDWNSVLDQLDTTRNFQPKFCKVLSRLVKNLNYIDSFRHLHPGVGEYTFHRGPHVAQSRLDRIYLPPHLVQYLVSAQHMPSVGDHCQVEVELDIRVGQARPAAPKKKTFWK